MFTFIPTLFLNKKIGLGFTLTLFLFLIRKGYLIISSMRNELQELFLYANGFQFCNPNGYPNHEA